MCKSVNVGARRRLAGVGSLLRLCGFWGLSVGCQVASTLTRRALVLAWTLSLVMKLQAALKVQRLRSFPSLSFHSPFLLSPLPFSPFSSPTTAPVPHPHPLPLPPHLRTPLPKFPTDGSSGCLHSGLCPVILSRQKNPFTCLVGCHGMPAVARVFPLGHALQ